MQKSSGNDKGSSKTPNMSVSWGRGASEYRPGVFTKQYFLEHGETCAADIYRALSEEIERLNQERVEIDEKPFRRPNYSSFAKYFHWFKLLGLVEPTGRHEQAIYDFLQERVYYKLTDRGRTEMEAWQDPVRMAHPEFG
jgi:DNA-binding PadR family transcriptional regulator